MVTPKLLLGPVLRHTDATSAAVWVETDAPCRVEVAGASADTFTVHGHHYALVEVVGLTPGGCVPYTVRLDGHPVWPLPGSPLPASRIRTPRPDAPARLAFGSCRTSTGYQGDGLEEYGPDALRGYANRLLAVGDESWPDLLLLLGDQAYADEPPRRLKPLLRSRRERRRARRPAPSDEVADYTEYARLYRTAWRDPLVRWLLSTVPTSMIFDDHEVRDDWNISADWQRYIRSRSWWPERISAALGSYWVYQHLGNLSPAERAADPVLAAVTGAGSGPGGDAGKELDTLVSGFDADPAGYRWSYARQLGPMRLVVLDCRAARVLTPGRRRLLDPAEWRWFEDQANGPANAADHLVIGSSLPYLLPKAVHHLERWNEAVCDGSWGRWAGRLAERIRQELDLEHWAAFRHSFDAMERTVRAVAAAERAPASVLFLSGDVHYSYLARVRRRSLRAATTVYQLVCSPLRNPMGRSLRWLTVVSVLRLAGWVGWLLEKVDGAPGTRLDWRINRGPWFENSIAELRADQRRCEVRWFAARAVGGDGGLESAPVSEWLEPLHAERLA